MKNPYTLMFGREPLQTIPRAVLINDVVPMSLWPSKEKEGKLRITALLKVTLLELIHRYGLAVVVTLYHFAAKFTETVDLFFTLSTLSQAHESQILGKRNDQADYNNILLTLVIRAEFVDKALVYLQGIERHLRQQRQGRVTRTEVVHGDLEAALTQVLQHAQHVHLVIVGGALGKLEVDQAVVHAVAVDYPDQVLDEIRVVQPLAREVD